MGQGDPRRQGDGRLKPLATARLALEPLVAAHAAEMFALLGDADIYRFIDEAPPVSQAALEKRYARLESRRSGDGREHWLNWVLREATPATAIGYVQATVQEGGTAWIAYVIAPKFQRRGFAREAVEAMIAELSASYGARQLRASVDAGNTASVKLLAALGFGEAAREGTDVIFKRDA